MTTGAAGGGEVRVPIGDEGIWKSPSSCGELVSFARRAGGVVFGELTVMARFLRIFFRRSLNEPIAIRLASIPLPGLLLGLEIGVPAFGGIS